MPTGQPASATTSPLTPAAQDVSLFIVLVILIRSFGPFPWQPPPAEFMLTLAFFIHIGVSLYLGIVGSLRTATWLLLIATWAGSELIQFAGYVSPWSIIWQASIPGIGTRVDWHSASNLSWLLGTWPSSIPVIVLLGFDLAVMHYPAWRRRSFWLFALMIAGAGFFTVTLVWLLSGPPPPAGAERPFYAPHLIPPLHWLPFFGIARALPGALAGVTGVFAAMLVPLIWPWVRADILRTSSMRWAWRLSCTVLAITLLVLVFLGFHGPDGTDLIFLRIGTAYYFAFFLLIPFILLRLSRRPAGRPF
ncbi:hypothetical protein [Reyranella sp. CPCC 100927]|uniref:hypothetical protein n=1 Tax=Reyranella sp. CPCC 100927 TaxID=2599616 RepID=UPI0011B37B11|nr:hypothetical protein [Reyranella sp. CPCC 100927]TWT09616.1 hypothetical protein FQU96_20870 [Reyranella sp. CPCC 100927]